MDVAVDDQAVSEIFRVLDLTGVLANAVLGGVIARRERLDPIGFVVLATLTGLGGGLIRDTLLQAGPPVALTDPTYLLTALAGAAIAYVVRVEGRAWDGTWPVVDAVALGCWASVGAQRTLDVGLGWLPAILLGTITATGGGLVRDVVLRRVPGILGGGTLYATSAIAAAGTQVTATAVGYPVAGSLVALAVGAGLVLLARRRGWMLPDADAWSRTVAARTRYRRLADRARPARRLRDRRHPREPHDD
ncbi:trimeric intracellular cation channel family protein [Nocardioides aurantiacus]|uniref:Putative membrane protein YeiH n=1 Tax=Nocardioides aurantiacus TaxID=86796 RepID=A0A3N2CZW4_9ACTN|nr:trimeric intracellular cation channel family protein [Nocardioides aurantiacus]ROR93046.1 putative membrane protein YeiH [Nocardioides aurantiacus]